MSAEWDEIGALAELHELGAAVRQPDDVGGWLPEYVNTDSAYQYLDDTDSKMNAVQAAISANAAKFDASFVAQFNNLVGRWREYYQRERNTTHMLDAVSVMNAVDRYVAELTPFDDRARSVGATPDTPPPAQPSGSSLTPGGSPLDLLAGAVTVGKWVVAGVLGFELLKIGRDLLESSRRA